MIPPRRPSRADFGVSTIVGLGPLKLESAAGSNSLLLSTSLSMCFIQEIMTIHLDGTMVNHSADALDLFALDLHPSSQWR